MIPLAYAASLDFIFSFDGGDVGGGVNFEFTEGIAVNSTNFIIVGDNLGGDKVQIFDSTGSFIRALSGGAVFNDPEQIAVNSTNFIIVGSSGSDIVEIYDKGGFFVRALSGGAGLTNVLGVAVNSTGFIFVADGTDIEIYNKGGFFQKLVTGTGLGGTNFSVVSDITVDSNDRLLVLDSTALTLQIFDGNEQFVSSFAGTSGGGTIWVDPQVVATDTSNRIFVSDNDPTPDTVQIYDSTGSFLSTFDPSRGAGSSLEDLTDITFDSNNRLLVIDSGAIDLVQIYEGFSDAVDTPSGGSGDQAHKTRPTFGLSHYRLQLFYH